MPFSDRRNIRPDGSGTKPGAISNRAARMKVASMIVAWFSRKREFRADAGGAYLAGTRSMIGALEALKRVHSPTALPEQMKAFGINDAAPTGLQRLLMSHPPLDERIAALNSAR